MINVFGPLWMAHTSSGAHSFDRFERLFIGMSQHVCSKYFSLSDISISSCCLWLISNFKNKSSFTIEICLRQCVWLQWNHENNWYFRSWELIQWLPMRTSKLRFQAIIVQIGIECVFVSPNHLGFIWFWLDLIRFDTLVAFQQFPPSNSIEWFLCRINKYTPFKLISDQFELRFSVKHFQVGVHIVKWIYKHKYIEHLNVEPYATGSDQLR